MLPLLLIPMLLVLAILTVAVKRVPDGEAWTVYRLGRHARTLLPGRHFVWPGLERVKRHVSLIGHHVEVPVHALGAADGCADLYYQILDPVQAGNALESADETILREAGDAIDVVAAQMPRQSTWTVAAADALKQEINRRVSGIGLRVIRCALHTA